MGTKNYQLIQEPNSIKLLEFVLKCVEDGENFDDVNFTDERSVHMENHAKISFRRKLKPPKMKGHPKHPYKVHIWTGISKRGDERFHLHGEHGRDVLHQGDFREDPASL